MLKEKFSGFFGKVISYTLILTTNLLPIRMVYAQEKFDQAVSEANQFAEQLRSQRASPTFDSKGNLLIDGKPYMSTEALTGQRENDYLPADPNTYGSDAKTLYQGQAAQRKYDEKTLETAETSSERAYHIIKKSFSKQKPDLSNDPFWKNTDDIFSNLEKIAEDFANCKIEKQLVSNGKEYHVPKYEKCERLPAVDETFTITHEYNVGVIKHKSGPTNLQPCGDGCMQVWIGTVGDNYWSGYCKIYEESMSLEVIQPHAITYVKLDRSKFDDYHQVYLNDKKIYNGPNANFPPETEGNCELSTSWDTRPNVNITDSFTNIPAGGEVRFKTRTSVAGNGEGYSSLLLYYNLNELIYGDTWYDQDLIDKAYKVKKQIGDGYCTGSIRCTDMPSLDASGCVTINGILVCENNFKTNPVAGLGISPFCRKIEVISNCAFNEGEFCSKDMNGVEHCFDNDTVERNQCKKYEEDPNCSYVKTDCVEGAQGSSGQCYVQEDTFDCGFTATTGNPTEEEVLVCDGKLQCIGESCYSSMRDGQNEDFNKVSAYLEMLKFARSDMQCEGIPDAPYNDQTPPDRYTPIASCPKPYVYNKDTNQCLNQTGCAYSDNDFYAASLRNGIQVLVNNSVVIDNQSISSCIPVTQSGMTYTCGNAMKKVATDTFYEVCTNSVVSPEPQSCPSEGHVLNPATGYCEIPPTPSCPEGYSIVEGNNQFSVEDDLCIIQAQPDYECTDKSQTYNITTGLCEGQRVISATCPNGGTLSEGKCVSNVNSCQWAMTGGSVPTIIGGSVVVQCMMEIKWDGVTLARDIMVRGGCSESMINTSYIQDVIKKNGLTYSGKSIGHNGSLSQWELCKGSGSQITTPYCPSGYILQGNQCYEKTTSTAIATCSINGTTFNKDKGYCYDEKSAQITCPSAYPIWDEKEGRCKSKSLSPLASRYDLPLNEQVSPNQQYKQIVALVLAPFEMMLGALVPPVTAESDLHGSEEAKVTQESMNEYVAEKFQGLAQTYQNDQLLYQAGTRQLLSIAATENSSMARSGGGEENVTCELFKGEAMECKIAVGGMQDCCESPVAPSLSDYITLTTKMLQLDALTGQVAGLENYKGVWDIASNWGGASVDSAWSAIQGEFISPADIVAQKAGEGATDTLMSQAAQKMMEYTNQFLLDTFGPEVAGMFFQEGVGGVVASNAMASVGAALTVVYYAYLAYVVFNLLIGIIFKCEDKEMDLAMKNELYSTHYIGTYCKSKVLGACIEKRRSYCVFNSPLSRIMMEQVYKQPQMGLSWGTAQNPNCTGLAIDQMDKIDWDLVNLDEWIGILVKTGNFTTQGDINIDALTGAGSNLNYKADGVDRLNVLESNKQRLEDIDIDEVRRAAYEDAWNKNQ
ncbi:conjugal transfer protein TraN [Vibrio cholerae]|nr:conjugal transfer protein TraN [Vibrio cholerae]